MPTLPNFTQFEGRYWDTAAIRNALDYQGVKAPHTGQPYSEAMLLGISGGVTFGYFTFHYKGYDPQVNLLTRNTFAPMETIFERLGIDVAKKQTASADKGRQNLIEALEAGKAPIASPDMWLLPYNALPYDAGMWGGMPLVIFGYEPDKGEAYISDRSKVALTVATDELDAARARTKKDRHRLLLLGEPDESRLAEAVKAGLAQCVGLMTEKPPKGAAKNFGFKALEHWADMLSKRGRGSWAKEYATGRTMMAAMTSAYTFLGPAFGKTIYAERDVYGDFLEEAAIVLGKDSLKEVASLYHEAGKCWHDLWTTLLSDHLPELDEARQIIDRKTDLFIEGGAQNLDEIIALRDRLAEIMNEADSWEDYVLEEVMALRITLIEKLTRVERYEWKAVEALKEAIA